MTDAATLKLNNPIADVIGRYVDLKPDGREFKGLCPFHADRNPSFSVVAPKGFAICFACGWSGDVLDFVQEIEGIGFKESCERLGSTEVTPVRRPEPPPPPIDEWTPILPVPDDAPDMNPAELWNQKRNRQLALTPLRVDAYRDPTGALLGFVLRCQLGEGKWTPTVTFCADTNGRRRWCLVPFPEPRPLMGLDDLAARPEAKVLVVSGEKCKAAANELLGGFVAVTWAGGDQGVRHTDWTPLKNRELVIWPDADDSCRAAADEIARIVAAL